MCTAPRYAAHVVDVIFGCHPRLRFRRPGSSTVHVPDCPSHHRSGIRDHERVAEVQHALWLGGHHQWLPESGHAHRPSLLLVVVENNAVAANHGGAPEVDGTWSIAIGSSDIYSFIVQARQYL